MKDLKNIFPVIIVLFSLAFFTACNKEDTNETLNQNNTEFLSEEDKKALLFMLEEEKLARDTYTYLNNLWSINQFKNIKNSEQTHMDAVEKLLIKYNIDYTILPVGQFENKELQDFYNQFKIDGSVSKENAFQIGATIEDLDIVDLQEFIAATSNTTLIDVFENLVCGSRNHLRSFVKGVTNSGSVYTPQFLTQEEYNSIITSSQEQCN